MKTVMKINISEENNAFHHLQKPRKQWKYPYISFVRKTPNLTVFQISVIFHLFHISHFSHFPHFFIFYLFLPTVAELRFFTNFPKYPIFHKNPIFPKYPIFDHFPKNPKIGLFPTYPQKPYFPQNTQKPQNTPFSRIPHLPPFWLFWEGDRFTYPKGSAWKIYFKKLLGVLLYSSLNFSLF